jgi:phosphatidate cytidylyltransferase
MSQKREVLRQRSITGIVFAAVVLLLVYSGKFGALALLAIIACGGSYEYLHMIFPKNGKKLRLCLFVTIGIIISLLSLGIHNGIYPYVVVGSCVMLVLGIVNMFRPFINHKKWYWLVSALYLGLPIGLFMAYIYYTDIYPRAIFLSILGLIWMSDSLAYLVGSQIGKTKLLEKISPKKTWEGWIGGGVFTLALVYFIQHYQSAYSLSFWLWMAFIVWIVGTIGDLVESSIKRTFEIKDSGKLLPGHGGLLDRFDSFIYVLPFILLLLLFTENNISF